MQIKIIEGMVKVRFIVCLMDDGGRISAYQAAKGLVWYVLIKPIATGG